MRQINTMQPWFWSHHRAQHSCVYSHPRRWNSWSPSCCYSSGGVLQQQRLKQEAADQTWPAPSLCSEGGLTEDSSEAQIKEICLFNWLHEIELGRRWRKGNIAQSAVASWRNEKDKESERGFPSRCGCRCCAFHRFFLHVCFLSHYVKEKTDHAVGRWSFPSCSDGLWFRVKTSFALETSPLHLLWINLL